MNSIEFNEKNLKLDFNITGGPYQDLYEWDVSFEGEITVMEFLRYVLTERKGDWGEIIMNSNVLSLNKNKLCEYKHGEMFKINQQLLDEVADKTIKAISAFGGYTNMKYLVRTEDERLIQAWEQIEKLESDFDIANRKACYLADSVREKDDKIKSLKKEKRLLEQQITGMKKASLWQRIRGWKE